MRSLQFSALTKTKFIDFKNSIKIHAINGTTGAELPREKKYRMKM